MFNDHRHLALFLSLIAREDQAYRDALAALDDPAQTDDVRRDKVKAFIEAGGDMMAVGLGAEVH